MSSRTGSQSVDIWSNTAKDGSGTNVQPIVDADGRLVAASLTGLEVPPHDYIGLSYTGENLTGVVYKTGGSGGTTVCTLTLGYDVDKLTSVTKS